MKLTTAALAVFCLMGAADARPMTVYIAGFSYSANYLRKHLASDARKGKGCITIVARQSDAEAILEVGEQGEWSGFHMPTGVQLVNRSTGDIIWAGDSNWGPGVLSVRVGRAVCSLP